LVGLLPSFAPAALVTRLPCVQIALAFATNAAFVIAGLLLPPHPARAATPTAAVMTTKLTLPEKDTHPPADLTAERGREAIGSSDSQ
jgi:hypothetical protein